MLPSKRQKNTWTHGKQDLLGAAGGRTFVLKSQKYKQMVGLKSKVENNFLALNPTFFSFGFNFPQNVFSYLLGLNPKKCF